MSDQPSADDPIPGSGDPVATGAKGGGEWPSKDTPPTDAAPGSDPARAASLRRQRQERTGPSGLDSPYEDDPDQAAVGSTASHGEAPDEAGDAGAARQRGPAPSGSPTTEQT